MQPQIVKVSKSSIPAQTAGAIAHILRANGIVQVQAAGAFAVNQAAKAMAVARKFMLEEESDLSFRPRLETVEEGSGEITLMIFEVVKL